MKRLLCIFLILLTLHSKGQPIVQRSTSSVTPQDARLSAQLNFFIPRYSDTSQANSGTNLGVDSLGALIFTYADSKIWKRVANPKHWVEITAGGAGSGTVTNFSFTNANGFTGVVTNPTTTPNLTLTYNAGWKITGNSGTTAGTNFLGTTDNVSLMFKTNSIQSGLITTTGATFFGYQAGLNNISTSIGQPTAFGYQALKSMNISNPYNTAFGYQSLMSTTSGFSNTGVGFQTLLSNTTGNNNSAFGRDALLVNTTGSNNTAIGSGAIRENILGKFNTAIGAVALNQNQSDSNTAVGVGALQQVNSGYGNTAIGVYAANESSSSVTYSIALGMHATPVSNQFCISDNINFWKSKGLSKGGTTLNYVMSDTTGNGDLVLQLFSGIPGKVHTVSGTLNRITVTNGTTDAVVDIAATYVGQTSITTLGTITTGTWHATPVTTPYGGTGLSSFSAGSMMYYVSGTTMTLLSIGTSGQMIRSTGSAPQWFTPTFIIPSDTTAKWLTRVYKLAGTDSIFYQVGASNMFSFIDSTGVTAFTNGNGFVGTLTHNLPHNTTLSLATNFTGIAYSNGTGLLAEIIGTGLTENLGTLTWNGVNVRQSGVPPSYTERGLNFIPGSNVTITLGDDPGNNRVNITIGATGGGGGGGTVDSLSVTDLSPLFTTTVTNPTSNPHVAFILSTAGAHKWFGNNTGSTAAPDFETINAADIGSGAALTKTDDTNVTLTLSGTPASSLLAATNIAVVWNGVLSIARGGTNNGSLSVTNQNLIIADGTKLIGLAKGTSGQHLIVNGSGNLAWVDTTAAGGGGTVTSVAMTVPNIFAISGSPVTTSGTLAVTALCTTGDIIYASGTNTYSKLAIGTSKQHLVVVGGVPAWRDTAAVGTGTVTSVALSVPSLLTISGSPITTSGTFTVTWNGITTGGLVYGSGTNTAANLPIGTTGYLLEVVGGVPTWVDYGSEKNPGKFWSVTGNGSTVAGTNFIGTTDDVDLVGKRSSVEIFRLTAASFNLTGNSTNAGTLKFYEDTDDGTNFTSFKVGTQAGDIAYTLPTGYPSVTGYVLSATTAGVMSWIAQTGAVSSVTTTDGNLVISPTTGAVIVSTNKVVQLLTDASTITWNVANGFNARDTLTGNRTLSITNPQNGSYYTITVVQDATGSRTLTLPGGTTATLNTTAGDSTEITGYYRNNAYVWRTSVASSGGTVTSFSAGTLSPLFTTSVATATTTPALTFTLTNATGGTLFGNNTTSSAAPAYTAAPVLGIAGTTAGTIGLSGATSGVVTLKTAAAAGTYNWNYPITAGTSGYLLTSGGGGTTAMTWTDPATFEVPLTFNSGLTRTVNTVTLGGTLLATTTINTGGFATTWTGANAGTVFTATNTSSGTGLFGTSSSGTGVFGLSTSGYGGQFSILPSTTNTIDPIISVSRGTSGTAANGIGGAIEFHTMTDDGSLPTTTQLISKLTIAAVATRTSQFDITGLDNTTTKTFMNIQTAGIVRVNNLADTLATKAYARSVGGGGGGGGGTVTSVATSSSASTISLTGSPITTSGTLNFEINLGHANTWTANQNFTTTVTTGTGTTAGMNILANSLTTGNGVDISSTSITTGNLLKITSTSTVGNGFSAGSIAVSGANGTSSKTVTGLTISVTNTGTTSTNIGLVVTASGATTNTAASFTGAVSINGATDFNGNTITGYTAAYNVQTGTTYTLVSADAGKIITLNNASAITLTVPTSLPAGFTCTIVQLGAGQVTFTASGTTINNRQSFTKTKGQYAVASITQYSTNNFITGGDMQ